MHADADTDSPGDDSAYQHAGAYTDPDSDGDAATPGGDVHTYRSHFHAGTTNTAASTN